MWKNVKKSNKSNSSNGTKIWQFYSSNKICKAVKISDQMSESLPLALLLALTGGYFDAYSYLCRDGVFANAQTGNIVKLGIYAAQGNLGQSLRFLIPIVAFVIGSLTAMYIRDKNSSNWHWRQWILLGEIIFIILIAFIPLAYISNIAANVLISFICAMQAQSFRKFMGKNFYSTMCTGNLRSATEALYNFLHIPGSRSLADFIHYHCIIIVFIFGAAIGVIGTELAAEKSILFTLIPLVSAFTLMFIKPSSIRHNSKILQK